jgi:hypothetical protein
MEGIIVVKTIFESEMFNWKHTVEISIFWEKNQQNIHVIGSWVTQYTHYELTATCINY